MEKAREDNFSQDLNTVLDDITKESWNELQINAVEILEDKSHAIILGGDDENYDACVKGKEREIILMIANEVETDSPLGKIIKFVVGVHLKRRFSEELNS